MPLEAQPEDRGRSQINWCCEHTCVARPCFNGAWRFVTCLCVNAVPQFVCSPSGIISTFLHVHPFGASIEYICSYLQRLDTKVPDRLTWIETCAVRLQAVRPVPLQDWGSRGPAVPLTQAVLLNAFRDGWQEWWCMDVHTAVFEQQFSLWVHL